MHVAVLPNVKLRHSVRWKSSPCDRCPPVAKTPRFSTGDRDWQGHGYGYVYASVYIRGHVHMHVCTRAHTYACTHIYFLTPSFIHSLFRSYIHSTCTIFTDVFVFVFLEAGSRLESAVQMLHKSSVALLFLVPGMALKLMSNAAVACIRRSFRDELKVSVCQRFRRTLWQFTLTWRAKMRQQQTTRRAMSKRCEKDYNSLCDV